MADGRANQILRLNAAGEVVQRWGKKGKAPAEFDMPHMLAFDSAGSLYVAVAILGATVMPHNLYLHSSLVQTRAAPTTGDARRRALRYNLLDTIVALNVAFCINAAILVVAADVFHSAGVVVTDLREAQQLLTPLLGTGLAGLLFAVALL